MNNPMIGGNLFPQMANMQNVMQQYNQFRQMFQGDPRQQVQQMLNSGKVSQTAYNNAYQMARQFQQMMGGK